MSGTTTNTNIFTAGTSEYGMRMFSDPHTQESYKNFEDEYKKKYVLKQAYDKQEFLRKMRTDIRREYLTRKKQVKHLQKDAAIDFRNAEMSLQEHYAGAQEKPFSIRAIDISAPLVSQVTLPAGNVFDVKTFHPDTEFEKVVEFHKSLSQQKECQAQQEDETPCWLGGPECAICERRAAFGGCYNNDDDTSCCSDDNTSIREEEELACELRCQREIREAQQQQQQTQQTQEHDDETLDSDNKWNLPMTAVQKMVLEKGEAAQKERDEDPRCYWTYIGTHDAIDHAGWLLRSIQQHAPTIGMTDEEREAYYQELRRVAYEAASPVSDEDQEDEEEQMKREAAFQEYYRQHMDNEEREAMVIPDVAPIPDEPASTGGSSSAIASSSIKSKKQHASAAAKARVAKQQQKKKQQQQQQKFVPIKVTINDNRSTHSHDETASAMLSASKIEINLPKKNLQNVSREAMKRHNQKWNRINAQNKQSAARGTGIANLPSRRHDDDGDSDYE